MMPGFLLRTDLNMSALVICAVMFIAGLRTGEKHAAHNRLFRLLILSTSLLLALEAACWVVEGRAGSVCYLLNYAGELSIYLLTPIPPLIWAFYVNVQLLHDKRRLKQAAVLLSVPAAVSALLTITSPLTGAMFTISSANVYQRGPLFAVLAAAAFLPITYSLMMCIIYRTKMSRHMFVPLSLFAVPPVIGAVLQIIFYGTTLIWSSITLSLFIIHASIQSRQYNIDHLTGVFSRHPLDNVLHDRITTARGTGRRFACIMLDIDDFKHINDSCGHVAGDEALKDAAAILRDCIHSDDILARYAGDEFIVVMDTPSLAAPRQVIERIGKSTEAFNRSGIKPYSLSFSAGAAVYEPGSGMDLSGFLKHVDTLMYQDKKRKKASPVFFPVPVL